MKPNRLSSLGRVVASTIFGCVIFSASYNLQAAVSQQPLSLTEGVAPNLLVTLDDSGSMAWAFAPDSISGQTARRAWRSNTYNSMYYDPETVYRVPKRVTMVGGVVTVTDYPAPSFTAAPSNGYVAGGAVNLSTQFRAQDSGTGWLTSCPSGYTSGNTCNGSGQAPAHYFQYTVSGSCPEQNPSNADACYTYKKVQGVEYGIDQQANFSIWYSFYRTRNLATRSAASLAFYTLPEDVRLTWGALNTCNIGSNSAAGTCNSNTMKRFADQHRVNFFNWLSVLPQSGGTPLHSAMQRAGDFLRAHSLAYGGDGNDYACRASYHILMTDGMWNGNSTGAPSPNDNSLGYPYRDSGPTNNGTNANTLADWAYYYWKTDLRTGLGNNVSPYMPFTTGNSVNDENDPRNNPATWQNMVNFTVGLGLSRAMSNAAQPTWGGSTFANYSELMNMATNGRRWPTVGNDNANNVYDLWHAAINSRGEFFSADSPDSLVRAFDTVLARIGDRSSSAAKPAISSGLVDGGGNSWLSYAYQTSYASNESWAGDLKAYTKTRVFNSALGKYEFVTNEQWSARSLLASRSYSSRNIKIASTTGLTKLKALTWGNAGDAFTAGTLAYYLRQNPEDGDTLETTSTKAAQRLNFLSGDRYGEGSLFRERKTVLGDMIGSSPAVVRGARYLVGAANSIEGNDKYSAFYLAQESRVPHVYVGANDGMLHAFNANTGHETFAFVPTTVFSKLHKLTGRNYEGAHHQFYVDGSPVVSDVYINNEWRTVLIGTLRAGGKGLFALDVTDPANIKLLWEFGESSLAGKDVGLGYSFPRPVIARLHDGKWAVVTGNGYEAATKDNGKAALLLINVADGTLIKSLEVVGKDGVANGLSTPKLVDMNVDGVADFAYAGDIQGNMWRFDLLPKGPLDKQMPFKRPEPVTGEATMAMDFKVAYKGKPIFTAATSGNVRQAITSAPSVVRHSSGYGLLVSFGTGKYYEEGDKNGATSTQSIYGIWDAYSQRPAKEAQQPSSVTRSSLQAQSMDTSLTSVSSGREARVLSDNDVQWAVPTTSSSDPDAVTWSNKTGDKYGWYFDLRLPGEMMVEAMSDFGDSLVFQTLVPNNDPCLSGVENWTYAINPMSGGRTRYHVFSDFRSVANPDTVISAIRQDGEGGITVTGGGDSGGGDGELCTSQECLRGKLGPKSFGRQTWRKVPEE